MLIGYNNDVQYRGLTFHIQTEDRGSGNDQSVESQLFQGGQILDTKITPYADLVASLNDEERDKKIRSIMQASHKGLFKKLKSGEYNHLVGLDAVESIAEEVDEADFTPSQERVPDQARLVEQEGETAFQSPNAGDHVDLAALKSKLAGLAGTSELNAVSETSTASDDAAVDSLFDDFIDSKPGSSKPGTKKSSPAADKSNADDEPLTLVLDAQTLTATASMRTTATTTATQTKTTPRGATNTLESHKPAPISPAVQAARAAAARLNPARSTADLSLVDFEPTGQLAWSGCNPSTEDLSLLTLVEAFLHG